MAEPEVKTGTEAAQTMIYNLVREPAREQLTTKINRRVNNVLEGVVDENEDGKPDENVSWMQWLQAMFMSIIFSIAKMFGAENWLASAFGMPIPDEKEVDKLSHQVAASVSHTLAKETDLKYNNRTEFKEALTERVLGSLHANRANYPSFTNDHLLETAQKTVDAVLSDPRFAGAFDKDGNKIGDGKAPFLELVAAAKFNTVFEAELDKNNGDTRKQLEMLSGGRSFGNTEMAAVSSALAPALVKFESKKPTDVTKVASEFKSALDKSPSLSGWSPAARDLFADMVAKTYMKEQHSAQIPADFQKGIDSKTKALAGEFAHIEIKKHISEAMSATTAEEVMKTYDNRNGWAIHRIVTGGYNPSTAYKNVEEDIKKLQAYYNKDDKGNYTIKPNTNLNAVRPLQEKLANFAANMQLAPNEVKRNRISAAVAQTVIENIDLPNDKLANQLQINVEKNLKSQDTVINAGLPENQKIQKINEKSGGDIYKTIAEKLAEKIRTDTAIQAKLQEARNAMQGNKTAALESALNNADSLAGNMQLPTHSDLGTLSAPNTRFEPKTHDNGQMLGA